MSFVRLQKHWGKRMARNLNFDQLMVLGAIKVRKLDFNPEYWPEDAAFYRGLARLAIIIHRTKQGEFGTAEDEEAFQWWESCKDGECKVRAIECMVSLRDIPLRRN